MITGCISYLEIKLDLNLHNNIYCINLWSISINHKMNKLWYNKYKIKVIEEWRISNYKFETIYLTRQGSFWFLIVVQLLKVLISIKCYVTRLRYFGFNLDTSKTFFNQLRFKNETLLQFTNEKIGLIAQLSFFLGEHF